MITILWGNALTFVKYILKYSDSILMFEDYIQICVFRCICVCVSGYMCAEKEGRDEENANVSREVASW